MTRLETAATKASVWGYNDLVRRFSIPTQFHDDYVALVQTGEARSEFVSRLDTTPQWQEAVELGLARRIEHIDQVLGSF